MEVTDTGDPGREEFFRNLFQSTGVTASQAGPCENRLRGSSIWLSPASSSHHRDRVKSMIHQRML